MGHTTHYACSEQLEKYGGKTIGCCCTGHECKDEAGGVGQSPAHSKDSKGVLKEKLDEILARQYSMSILQANSDNRHREYAIKQILNLFTEVLTELLKDTEGLKKPSEMFFQEKATSQVIAERYWFNQGISECQRVIEGRIR